MPVASGVGNPPRSTDLGSVLASDAVLLRNARRAGDLSFDLVPTAIVTPDGTAHFEGQMELFGMLSHADPYWEDAVDSMREQYAECLAIGLDVHA